MSTKYRKKPVVIEAMQWDGTAEGATPIIEWVLSNGGTANYVCSDPVLCSENDGDCPHSIVIETLEGPMRAGLRWWVIRGVVGEFYPCDPDVFEMSYDAEETR